MKQKKKKKQQKLCWSSKVKNTLVCTYCLRKQGLANSVVECHFCVTDSCWQQTLESKNGLCCDTSKGVLLKLGSEICRIIFEKMLHYKIGDLSRLPTPVAR